MDHRLVEEHLDEFITGKLSPALIAQIEAHLKICVDCSELVSDVRKQLVLARHIAAEVHEPHPSQRVSILEAAAELRARRRGWWFMLVPAGSILAGVIALLVLPVAEQRETIPASLPALSAPSQIVPTIDAELPPPQFELKLKSEIPVEKRSQAGGARGRVLADSPTAAPQLLSKPAARAAENSAFEAAGAASPVEADQSLQAFDAMEALSSQSSSGSSSSVADR